MTDNIKPALTADEWEEIEARRGDVVASEDGRFVRVESFGESVLLDAEDDQRHALAALCLYQQPFGFTREDVQLLKERFANDHFFNLTPAETALSTRWRSLAARLAALLPPEETP